MSSEGPALNKQQLVAVLVQLARQEGAYAINMRRVAAAAGVSPRLLYNFVRNKEEMIDLLCEEIIHELLPGPVLGTWRERLHTIATVTRQGVRQYPGIPTWMLFRAWATMAPAPNRMAREVRSALAEAGLSGAKLEATYLNFAMITLGGMVIAEGRQKAAPDADPAAADALLEMGLQLALEGVEKVIFSSGK